jgi:hypothetical protein
MSASLSHANSRLATGFSRRGRLAQPGLCREGVTVSPCQTTPQALLQGLRGSMCSRLPCKHASGDVTRRRRASRVLQMCPECVRVFSGQTTTKANLQALYGSSLTDSNRRLPPYLSFPRQRVATHGNGFGSSEPFRRRPICDWLPPVATARLHKRSSPAPRIRRRCTRRDQAAPTLARACSYDLPVPAH